VRWVIHKTLDYPLGPSNVQDGYSLFMCAYPTIIIFLLGILLIRLSKEIERNETHPLNSIWTYHPPSWSAYYPSIPSIYTPLNNPNGEPTLISFDHMIANGQR